MQKKMLSLALLLISFCITLAVPTGLVSGNGGTPAIWALQNGLPDYPNSPHVTAFEIPSGTILRQFVAPVKGNGRGLAFDGATLYYTLYYDPGIIYKMSTTGTDLGSITLSDPELQIGAMTWDGSQLWGAAYDGTSRVFTIDPGTGIVTLQFTFAGWIAPVDSQYGVQGYMDGLEYDTASNTLWLSDDAGLTVYNVDLGGTVISWFSVEPLGNTGIVWGSGPNLWLVLYDPPNPDVTYPVGIIQETTTTGTYVSHFAHDGKLYEDLAGVDTITFIDGFVIPEYPFGTIVGLLTSFVALVVFAKSRRLHPIKTP